MKKTTFAALAAACLLSFTLGFAVTAAETPAADNFDQELEGQSSFAAPPAETDKKCDRHEHGKDGKTAEGHSCSKEHAEECGDCCQPAKDGEEAKCGECCKDGKCGECCGKDGKHDGHGGHHGHGKQGAGDHGGHGNGHGAGGHHG